MAIRMASRQKMVERFLTSHLRIGWNGDAMVKHVLFFVPWLATGYGQKKR